MATHSCPPPAAMMSSTMRLFGCTRASTTSTPWS
uniref:Armadillo like helical domain containing 3 n=1 Tax=Rousettus aegyptiacus TaxID=9407 RepID=A0A7J8G3S2_ROUAE|nr:armadillo like helical domain containing 3 [Rousettus aegyptiacus]